MAEKSMPKRTTLAVLAAAALATALPVALPSQAEAAPAGRVCFFLDEQGAHGAGHVAWAVRDPKNAGRWVWGSTDNAEGDTATLPGHDNGSWSQSGTWKQLRGETAGKKAISLRSYESYRCVNTAGGDLPAAQRTYRNMKDNGYQVLYNNCLTKAIAIFRKYSPALSGKHLPDGQKIAPKYYFYRVLNDAPGWEHARPY
ncbi:Tat pathway signal protein [Streptomyces sp. NPDC054838]